MNIPNALSIFRILLVPVFVLVFFKGGDYGQLYATGIFLLAGLTDVADGHIARKYNQISVLGRILDPAADKLMVLAALICCLIAGYIPMWAVILYAIKEICQGVCGLILYRRIKEVPPANIIGKTGTVLFYITIAVNILADELSPFIKYGLLFVSFAFIFVAFASYVKAGVSQSKNISAE